MKKKAGVIVILCYVISIIAMTYLNIAVEKAVLISIIFLIAAFFTLFETGNMDAKTMAAVATMSALGGVLRIPFAAIPGLQPVTFICAVSGLTLGPVNGFMVGNMCAFISNFFLGHGPWTLWQMMGWGLCGAFFGIFQNKSDKIEGKPFTVLLGIWGYIFGIILDQWYIVQAAIPITIKIELVGIAASFPVDTVHAVGNVFFAALFGKNVIKALKRYTMKNKVEYMD